ncbi:16233_t:CDS:2 [Funneliformis mosseae]|uniref:16233_t:CDS:1 n=1 Tax=Funneliformis mosseae TaxID=27381 RepID=A0A9N9A377_FUNMO|nr:16233_t:CDS:2 [Funneliformis mosseae]
MKLPRRVLMNSGIRKRWYTPVGSHVYDNDPVILDREKKRLLNGNVKSLLKSAPGWNEMLASDSEAVVKAEREPDSFSLKELQQESLKILSTIDSDVKDDVVVVEQIKQESKVQKIKRSC